MPFNIKHWEASHNLYVEKSAKLIESIFATYGKEAIAMAKLLNIDTSKPFSFKDYPATKKKIQAWLNNMANSLEIQIGNGTKKEWDFANAKNDAFVKDVLSKYNVPEALKTKYAQRNVDALKVFQNRKDAGLNLSDRVWKYTNQFKSEMEMAIDIGLDGRSAQQLSQDVRQYLNEPEKLFRRVRDKYGNLQLSKHAKAYHPGAGVYRSSARNSQRLARTEINMAYRTADHERYQQLDFIVGFEVHRSNHFFGCDVCESLKGKYPKTFIFKGWHPNCRCFITSILATKDEMNARFEAELQGKEYDFGNSKNVIVKPNDGFTNWIKKNKDRIATAKTLPYFLSDNKSKWQL